MKSQHPGRKPLASRPRVVLPPAAPRVESRRRRPITTPSMAPEEIEQAESYASNRPLHGVGRTSSTEAPIRDPRRLAEIQAQLLGVKEK
jgi:hypothetical protein